MVPIGERSGRRLANRESVQYSIPTREGPTRPRARQHEGRRTLGCAARRGFGRGGHQLARQSAVTNAPVHQAGLHHGPLWVATTRWWPRSSHLRSRRPCLHRGGRRVGATASRRRTPRLFR